MGPSLEDGAAKGVDNLNRIFRAETGVLLPSGKFAIEDGRFTELGFVEAVF